MPFEMWGYHFERVFQNARDLPSRAGVFVIWCRTGDDDWGVLDIGESEDVREGILDHQRSHLWKTNCTGAIYFAATYTDDGEEARKRIEQNIKNQTNIICNTT